MIISELKLILQFSLAMNTLDLSYQCLIHIAFIISVIFPRKVDHQASDAIKRTLILDELEYAG
jgi:hypothetical protein